MTVQTKSKNLFPALLVTHLLAMTALTLAGLISGFFYAYSSSVMFGLNASEPHHAIAAMQGINREVRNIVFFPAFFLTPVFALAAGAALLLQKQRRAGTIFICSAAVYLFGGMAPTLLVSIPLNDALAAAPVPADVATANAHWQAYAQPWTLWNTVRTGFSAASLAMAGAALFFWGKDQPKI